MRRDPRGHLTQLPTLNLDPLKTSPLDGLPDSAGAHRWRARAYRLLGQLVPWLQQWVQQPRRQRDKVSWTLRGEREGPQESPPSSGAGSLENDHPLSPSSEPPLEMQQWAKMATSLQFAELQPITWSDSGSFLSAIHSPCLLVLTQLQSSWVSWFGRERPGKEGDSRLGAWPWVRA